jgi:hypothetical protein
MTTMKVICHKCHKELQESEILLHGGMAACEKCVREEYKSPPYHPDEADKQLKERSAGVRGWLKEHLKHRKT